MKTVESLTSATKDMKAGNHKVKFIACPDTGFGYVGRNFSYYRTTICGVNDRTKKFTIDSSYGTQSTTRACNAYRKHFTSLGYCEIN
jgi:hypothetical protein